MAIIPPPASQKADVRPISFLLVDPTTPQVIAQTTTVTLAIRPEDLTRTDPSRLTVHQTLAGAWMDNFGPGIAGIVINGHTGWHRSQEGVQTPDGIDRWLTLRGQVFDNWHKRKQNAIKAGRDPDQIQLIFADRLDNIACVVATATLTLRRNKARPLLYQYQINMTVLDDSINPPQNAATPQLIANSPSDLQQAAIQSSSISISRLQSFAASMSASLPPIVSSLAAGAATFAVTAATLYGHINSAIIAGSGPQSLLSLGKLSSGAGASFFRTIAGVIPDTFGKAFAMQVAAEFSNIQCLLSTNAFSQQLFYEDYSALYGSSNCSSTNGGDAPSVYAIADSNPFVDVVPTTPLPPATVSTASLQSMQAVAINDPVLSPFSVSQLNGYMTSINSGFSVAAV
jgi:hypothetical protein